MKHGFTLLECLVYITCLVFFSWGITSLFYNVYSYNKKMSLTVNTYMHLIGIQEKIARLLTHQPHVAWEKTMPQEILWTTPTKEYGLQYKNNKLTAQEGHKITPLAHNIIITFTDITETGITCITEKNNCILEHYIALEHR